MKATPATLRLIADKLEQLSKVGVTITEFVVSGHRCRVAVESSQMDGTDYYVTNIVSPGESFLEGVARDH